MSDLLKAAKRVEPILDRLVSRFSEDSEMLDALLQLRLAIAQEGQTQ